MDIKINFTREQCEAYADKIMAQFVKCFPTFSWNRDAHDVLMPQNSTMTQYCANVLKTKEIKVYRYIGISNGQQLYMFYNVITPKDTINNNPFYVDCCIGHTNCCTEDSKKNIQSKESLESTESLNSLGSSGKRKRQNFVFKNSSNETGRHSEDCDSFESDEEDTTNKTFELVISENRLKNYYPMYTDDYSDCSSEEDDNKTIDYDNKDIHDRFDEYFFGEDKWAIVGTKKEIKADLERLFGFRMDFVFERLKNSGIAFLKKRRLNTTE